MTTVAYTDGACLGNPGPGGWAWAVPDGPFACGPDPHTTNQRMEINAALEAVRTLDGPLEIVSDSTYVVNCFRDRWWEGWIARGWLNKARKPVANRDLWEPLVDAVQQRKNVTFTWVKGHSADPMNDLVDRLAVEAATKQHGRTGVGRPDDLGPADHPGLWHDPRVPSGRKVAVVGHRPPELGGYDANPIADRVRDKLAHIFIAKRQLHPDLVVLTGLGLGAEQLAAEAAAEIGVPYVAVLPYPGQDTPWPTEAKKRFTALLDGAHSSVVLGVDQPSTKQQAGAALARRDGWLVRHADEAIAVWDGKDDLVGRVVRSLEDRLGDDVWVLDPGELT